MLPTPVSLTQTSNPAFLDGRPCFSPDGTTVLFMRQRITVISQDPYQSKAGRSAFYQVPINDPGSEQWYFSSDEYAVTRPDWSWTSGNNVIAFTPTNPNSTQYQSQFGLLEAISNTQAGAASTVEVTGFPDDMKLSYPSWYPCGEYLALSNYANNRIMKVSKDGAYVTNLTCREKVLAGMSSVNQQQEQSICMAAQPPNSASQASEYSQEQNNIYTQHEGDEPTLFSNPPPSIGRAPWWSPDGNWITYEGNTGEGYYQVYLQKSNQPASEAFPVSDCEFGIQHPKWSPDGNSIVMAVACQKPVKNQPVPWRIEMIDVSQYLT